MNHHTPLSNWVHAKATIDLGQRSNWHAWRIFVAQAMVYLACLFGASVDASPFLNIIFSLFSGFCIGQLFVIGHVACHQSLAKSRWVNHLIGRLCFLPSLHAYSLWRLEHNIKHHQHTNIKGLDPSWCPISKDEFQLLPKHRQWMERIYRSTWGGGLYYLLEMWRRNHVLPINSDTRSQWRKHLPDSLSIIAFILIQPLLLLSLKDLIAPSKSVCELYILIWAIPFLVWNWMMGFVIYLHHTHPEIKWFATAPDLDSLQQQLHVTAHVIFPQPINGLLYDIMAHNAHHIKPNIPLYGLRQAQTDLEASLATKNLTYHWTPASHQAIVRTCKLYDFDRQCWTDFDGVPTTTPSCN